MNLKYGVSLVKYDNYHYYYEMNEIDDIRITTQGGVVYASDFVWSAEGRTPEFSGQFYRVSYTQLRSPTSQAG